MNKYKCNVKIYLQHVEIDLQHILIDIRHVEIGMIIDDNAMTMNNRYNDNK